jgi:hypothetical protein
VTPPSDKLDSGAEDGDMHLLFGKKRGKNKGQMGSTQENGDISAKQSVFGVTPFF